MVREGGRSNTAGRKARYNKNIKIKKQGPPLVQEEILAWYQNLLSEILPIVLDVTKFNI